MNFRPMLAGKCEDVSKLQFPVMVSPKLDGIRCTVQGGKLVSRTLKPIPNVNVQELFLGLPEGLDGELIKGDPTAKDGFRETTTIVMADDKPATDVKLYAFDLFSVQGFKDRFDHLSDLGLRSGCVKIVPHYYVQTSEALETYEEAWLEEGYEGLMIRSLDGPYKQGRSTTKEGYLLKLKRFDDAEAMIISPFEEYENTNEATKNALGRTERSTKAAGKVAKGTLGGFNVVGLNGPYKDVYFAVGGGFTASQRTSFWATAPTLVGKTIKYKYFPTGSKDKPRFPVFLGFRDEKDM